MSKPTPPTINLNGSDGKTLVKGYQDAFIAIGKALDAVCQTCPHGRDYQISPAGTYEAARAEHVARLDALRKVRDEFEALALSVHDQVMDRRR